MTVPNNYTLKILIDYGFTRKEAIDWLAGLEKEHGQRERWGWEIDDFTRCPHCGNYSVKYRIF